MLSESKVLEGVVPEKGVVFEKGDVQAAGQETTTRESKPYDPQGDPLVWRGSPGEGQDYAPTYWVASAGTPPPDDGPINGDREVDVVIIGSGFTGLSCARVLGEEYGIKATVLEANRAIWGCTSRNGGQGQNASGRLTRSGWIQHWGKETALALDAELRESFANFTKLTQEIECDAQPGGHLYIAHRPRKMEFLRSEAKVLKNVYGYDVKIIEKDAFRDQFVDDHESHGAMLEPDGIGIHPLKLAFGYMKKARAAGATIHPLSPALGVEKKGSFYHVKTPRGIVKAKAVAFATGGYTCNGMYDHLDSKIMPILSNSMVTRVLTDAEIKAAGIKTNTFMTDTRTLRFYYRLLPDNRLQMGSRAALNGKDAPNQKHVQLLKDGLARKFPALAGVDIDYSWWGWVDVAHDAMPRIVQPDRNEKLYYAVGYGGNGVSFSQHAGRRMADRIAGRNLAVFSLPIYRSELEYPNLFNKVRSKSLSPFRRLGQRFLYRWYYMRDEAD